MCVFVCVGAFAPYLPPLPAWVGYERTHGCVCVMVKRSLSTLTTTTTTTFGGLYTCVVDLVSELGEGVMVNSVLILLPRYCIITDTHTSSSI